MKIKLIFSIVSLILGSVSLVLANTGITNHSKHFLGFEKIALIDKLNSKPTAAEENLLPDTWSKVRKNLIVSRHNIKKTDNNGIHKAVNLPNNLRIHFNKNDISITPQIYKPKLAWNVDLALTGYGYEGNIKPLSSAKIVVSDNRIEYQRGSLIEWYINDERGLEQGFTLREPPGQRNSGKLIVKLGGKSSLRPLVKKGSSKLAFVDAQGNTVLSYGKLQAWDAEGKTLPVSLKMSPRTKDTGLFQLALVVDDTGAKYPVIVDPLIASQVKKIIADDAAPEDHFGYSVAVYNDTMVVGAHGTDQGGPRSGSGYIFSRDQGGTDNWGLVKNISDGSASFDSFGYSVAIYEDIVAIYAPGISHSVSIFLRNVGGLNNWGHVKVIKTDSINTNEKGGRSIAIHGNTLVIGGNAAAYIFERDAGGADNWGQVKHIIGNNSTFGQSVAIYDDLVAVGATGTLTGFPRGSVEVFARDAGGADNWGMVKQIADDGHISFAKQFGQSVAIYGDTIAIGNPEFSFDQPTGFVSVFERHLGGSENWGRVKKIIPDDASNSGNFGHSVAIQTDTLVVGSIEGHSENRYGRAYVFERNSGGSDNWGQLEKITAYDSANDNHFGHSVAIASDSIVIGAHGTQSDNAHNDSPFDYSNFGAAYVFNLDNDESGDPYPFNSVSGLGLRAVIEAEEKGDI